MNLPILGKRMKRLSYTAMLLALLLLNPAVSVADETHYGELVSLRLLSPECQNESSTLYTSQRCVELRAHLNRSLIDCEVDRDGVLVMDEARNAYVCAKAKPYSSRLLVYPIPR